MQPLDEAALSFAKHTTTYLNNVGLSIDYFFGKDYQFLSDCLLGAYVNPIYQNFTRDME